MHLMMQVIKVSLVIFASLGGFGGMFQVVGTFRPIRRFARFRHLIKKAHTAAVVSTKASIPCSFHCSGDMVPCYTWRRHAIGATLNKMFLTSTSYQLTSAARSVTSLSASSSSQDSLSPKPLTGTPVWVQLYIDNVATGWPAPVKLERGANVNDLVKFFKFYSKFSEKLAGISSHDLVVHAWSDEQFTSPLRRDLILDGSSCGGNSIDDAIRVAAMTPIRRGPNGLVLPPDVEQWGFAMRESTNLTDFHKASKDAYFNFVDPTTNNLIGDDDGTWRKWRKSTKLGDFAVSLIRHQKALEKLQARIDGSSLDENVGETEVVDGCTARHLGASVIALELPNNLVDDVDASFSSPTVLSRSNARSIVTKTVDFVRSGKSVFVIGQPGIGNTRSCLLGCLASLLCEGAPVLYVSAKYSTAYLFIQKPDQSGYLGWFNLKYEQSQLSGDVRMIVLMDPPEKAGYSQEMTARLVKVCSNDHDMHFRNAYKSNQRRFLFPAMPKLEEVFAMAKVLWNDKSSNFAGKSCKDKTEMLNILAMRSFLVGCVPRHLFSLEQYDNRLAVIEMYTQQLNRNRDKDVPFYFRRDNEVIRGPQPLEYYPYTLFDLDGGDVVDGRATATLTFNGYARGLLLPTITTDRPNRKAFMQFVEESLLLGGTFMMKHFTFDYNVTGKAILYPEVKESMEAVVVPPAKHLIVAKKKSNQSLIRWNIRNLSRGFMYSTRRVTTFPKIIDFATSPSDWWRVRSRLTENATLSIGMLLREMRKHGLEKVTVTIVGRGKMPEIVWPFAEPMKDIQQSTMDQLKGITIRLWYLDSPSTKVNVGSLASQCKDGVFNLLPSQVPTSQLPELVASLFAATTSSSGYEELSVALDELKAQK